MMMMTDRREKKREKERENYISLNYFPQEKTREREKEKKTQTKLIYIQFARNK